MFHRRLLLLTLLMFSATGVLGGRLIYLAGVQGAEHLAEAEAALERRTLIKMVRGRILDRRGRVMAQDRACWDVVVDYEVITGRRAQKLASRDVRRNHRPEYLDWDPAVLDRVIEDYRRDYDEHERKIWQTVLTHGRISPEELVRRRTVIQRRVHLIRADRLERMAGRREAELGMPVNLAEVSEPIAEEVESHTILRDVSPEARAAFRKLRMELMRDAKRLGAGRTMPPGVELIDATIRQYPYRKHPHKSNVVLRQVKMDRTTLPQKVRGELPGHLRSDVALIEVDPEAGLIGRMRERIWAEDVDESKGGRPFRRKDGTIDLGGYLPGDHIGIGGIEQAEERRLRGLWGQKIVRKDTADESRTAPTDGQDIQLTIDVQLQARIQGLLDPSFGLMRVQNWHGKRLAPVGTPLAGAVVVMEVDTGEILALGSVPTASHLEQAKQNQPHLVKYIRNASLNRAVGAVYPPGSTLKPMVYAIAAADGAIPPHEHIDCTGYLLPGHPNKYRCWKYKMYRGMHGPIGADEALARSCNIYFYRLGQMLGGPRLAAGFRQWGFGQTAKIGLAREQKGLVPSEPEDLKRWHAILMGIGQGKIAVTPLLVAAAHATLARGGEHVAPLLIRTRRPEQEAWSLSLPPKAVDLALKGMQETMTYGTAKTVDLFKLEGMVLRAKTGTAQAPNLYEVGPDGKKRLLRKGDHSWFVCHVQRPGERRSAFVIVAMVEYGGSGGKVAGPVVNQVLHALNAEGYLQPKRPDRNDQKDVKQQP